MNGLRLQETNVTAHCATLAYRGGKALRSAPPSFPSFRVGDKSRTPVEIRAHIGDLLDWALCLVQGEHTWHDSTPLPWDEEVKRFFGALEKFDDYLASDLPLGSSPERLLQGPIADALTHVGQITMLRRLARSPVRGENYFKADIVEGRIGKEQSPPPLNLIDPSNPSGGCTSIHQCILMFGSPANVCVSL